MKILKYTWQVSMILASTTTLLAQTLEQTRLEVQSTKQIDKSGVIDFAGGSKVTGDATGVSASDTGMQRPIFLKTSNLSFFGGVTNSINRNSNPLNKETDIDIKRDGGHDVTWSKTFSMGALTNPIDINVAMLTIVAGGGWTATDHLIDTYKELDFDTESTSAYLLFMIQHESGWSYRLGSSYAMVKDPKSKAENYMEFYPNVGATKTFDLPFDTVGIFDISGGKHISGTDSVGANDLDRSTQDLWDFSVSLGLRYQLWDVMFSPKYSYTRKIYTTTNSGLGGALNKDRRDHTNTLGIGADYPLTDSVNIGANYSFEQRDSNNDTKYKSWSAGANVGLSLNF
jgi:opacity protein-like surface antigen